MTERMKTYVPRKMEAKQAYILQGSNLGSDAKKYEEKIAADRKRLGLDKED